MNTCLGVLSLAFVLFASSFSFADEQYFYTYTTGRDIRFSSITVTGVQAAGLRPGPTKTFTSNEVVGATALAPIFASGALSGFNIFKNFVGSDNKPALSRLLINQAAELQNEQPLTKIKPSRFDLLQTFQKGPATKLMVGFSANDVFGANLDPNGIALGGKFPVFNNPATITLGSANFAPDGEIAFEIVLIPVSNSPNSAARSFRGKGKRYRRSNGQQTGTFELPLPNETVNVDVEGDEEDEDGDDDDDDDLSTNPNQGVIVIVLRVFRNVGTATQQSQIQVQILNSVNAQPLGPAKALTNFVAAPNGNAEFFSSLAISPNADLVLYTVFSAACRQQILKAQQINPQTGTKIGGARVIVGCNQLPPNTASVGVYGLDIAEVAVN